MEKLRSLYRPGAKTSFYKQVVGFARQFRLENRAQLALDARFYYIDLAPSIRVLVRGA